MAASHDNWQKKTLENSERRGKVFKLKDMLEGMIHTLENVKIYSEQLAQQYQDINSRVEFTALSVQLEKLDDMLYETTDATVVALQDRFNQIPVDNYAIKKETRKRTMCKKCGTTVLNKVIEEKSESQRQCEDIDEVEAYDNSVEIAAKYLNPQRE